MIRMAFAILIFRCIIFLAMKLKLVGCYWLQIFNEFNARKPDEFNVFSGVTGNHLFMAIVGMTLVLQVGGIFVIFLLYLYVYTVNW